MTVSKSPSSSNRFKILRIGFERAFVSRAHTPTTSTHPGLVELAVVWLHIQKRLFSVPSLLLHLVAMMGELGMEEVSNLGAVGRLVPKALLNILTLRYELFQNYFF
jgi:hypothetical protein